MTHFLYGLRVLNTRPKNQSQQLSEHIAQAGGVSIELPALEIKESNTQWAQSLPSLQSIDIAIFISANAVQFCFKQLHELNIQWPRGIKVIAIGEASAKALQYYNIKSDQIPEKPTSEHLLKLDSLQRLKNKTVLLLKGKGGRPLIEDTVLARGAKLVILEVYQRVMPQFSQTFVNRIWQDDLVDIILFTSEQSMHNVFQMFGKEALSWLKMKPCLVLSERLAKSASLLGIRDIVVSHPDMIINALFDYSEGLNHGQ